MVDELDRLQNELGVKGAMDGEGGPQGIGRNEDLSSLLANRTYADVKFDFGGKNVIMTGASSGIGMAVARKLLHSGANVVMLGRNVNAMQMLLQDPKRRGKGTIKEIDLSEPNRLNSLFHDIMDELGGRLDILINSAGVMMSKNFQEVTSDEFDLVMMINVRIPL
jgi:NAD(P)-dependent dehydrogenase (short-subunit alcohol dehydrogenase family)